MRLLDINVLIALCDADHPFRPAAKRWFLEHARAGWATSPLTENGLLRILGHPNYPRGPGSPAAVRPLLLALCQQPGHDFWPDDASLRDQDLFGDLGATSPRDLSDLYLLGLAARRSGRFCTFDTRVTASMVRHGGNALELVPVA